MIRFRFVAVALFWIFPVCLSGQFYLTGENPPSVKWNSIKTRNFKVIFPASLAADAVKIAGQLEFALDSGADLKHSVRKRFPVLVQNGSMYSNGLVTLAPRRMELQIVPPQDSYAQDWKSQLSLHEFRHVAQLNMLDQGFTRVLGWFSGEIARGMVSAQIPSWFYEGDAVYNETRLSNSGRGRNAGFEMPLRTLLMQNDAVYSYDKAVFGSYRDFVPDAYIYGYKMTGYMRSHAQSNIWSDALRYVARHPYQIWPFSFYLKKNYGFYKSGLYYKTVDSLKQQYNRDKGTIKYSKATIYNTHSKKVFTDYTHPLQYGDHIIAFRKGLDDPGSFVKIDSTGNEQRLFYTGITLSGDADIYKSRLIWDEIVTDPRWEKRNYSVIKAYDIISGKIRALTRKTRYFSPDFSPDGSKIAVVEIGIENRNYLVILDSLGIVLSKIPTENKTIQSPEWSGIQEITMITVSDSGKQLESFNIATGEWTVHIPLTVNDISDPLHFNHYIIFRAESQNIENIFALDRNSGKIYKITGSLFGARYPALTNDKKQLIWTQYSSKGFDIAITEIDTNNWDDFQLSYKQAVGAIYDHKTELSNSGSYSVFSHLFRFHSWLPFYVDPERLLDNPVETKIYPGLMLFSQNILGTSISSIGYSYNNGYHYLHPSFEFRGLYPVFELNADAGGPHHVLSMPDGAVSDFTGTPVNFYFRTYLPLSFSRRAYSTFIRPELEYEFLSVRYIHREKLKRSTDLVHFRFTAGNFRRMATRDLYPVWGQSLNATYSFQPGGHIYGKLFSVRLNLYFPGLYRHHHFFIGAGFQKQIPDRYFLPYNRVNFPRGFSERLAEDFRGISLNYSFPFLYPDLTLGPILYVKRFRANIFYDFAYVGNMRILDPELVVMSGQLKSVGSEILADFHTLRIIFPITAGIRVGYMTSGQKVFAEFMMQLHTNL